MSGQVGSVVSRNDLLRMTVRISAAYVTQTGIDSEHLPNVISSVHHTLNELAATAQAGPEQVKRKPAVAVGKSVAPNYIVCLEDGRRMKMLKRHLKTAYNMTPDEYRERWGLPSDYPMVAPNYAKQRSQLAKKIGLGTRPRRR